MLIMLLKIILQNYTAAMCTILIISFLVYKNTKLPNSSRPI